MDSRLRWMSPDARQALEAKVNRLVEIRKQVETETAGGKKRVRK